MSTTGSLLPKMQSTQDEIAEALSLANKSMIAGGISGCVGKTFTAPLSRMTILYQVSPLLSSARAYSGTGNPFSGSLYRSTMKILQEEGVLALWKGNFTSVIHRFPYSAINFTVYEESMNFLKHHYKNVESPEMRFLCGATSGAVACFACYPLDLVRTRLTVAVDVPGARYVSVFGKLWSKFAGIIHKEGIFGLYRGLLISLGVTVPQLGVSFCTYGTIKEKMLHAHGGYFRDKHTGHLNATGSMISGAISGMTSSLLLFPADVIRRRMQVRGFVASAADSVGAGSTHAVATTLRGGAWAETKRILRAEGIVGLYRGILPELLKVSPTISITFCTYEYLLGAMTTEEELLKKRISR